MSPSPTARSDATEQAVLAANLRFYSAFQSLDVEAMAQVWAKEDWVQCVHPGWHLLLGWDEVRESYVRIFSNMQRAKLALSSVWVHMHGEIAWVCCTEHITSLYPGDFDEAHVQATNIFILQEKGWRLASHHASPLPPEAEPSVQ